MCGCHKTFTILAILLGMIFNFIVVSLLIAEFGDEKNVQKSGKAAFLLLILPFEALYGVLRKRPARMKHHLIVQGCIFCLLILLITVLAFNGPPAFKGPSNYLIRPINGADKHETRASVEMQPSLLFLLVEFGFAAGITFIFFYIELKYYCKIKKEKKLKEEAEKNAAATGARNSDPQEQYVSP